MTRLGIILLAVVLLTGGCTRSDRPATYPVTGVVKYNGNAIEDAMIVFVPIDSEGKSATARSDSKGKFKMGTFQPGDGVVSGSYNIKVSKYEGLEPAEAESVYLDAEEESKIYNPDDKPFQLQLPKNILPKMYEDENTSGFTITVGTTAVSLDLLLE